MSVLICLSTGAAAFGGPFARVPGTDRAYADWAFLAERGIVMAPAGRVVSAREPITRTDFALGLLPLAQALTNLDASPQGAPGLRGLLADLSADDLRQAAARMASLLGQFRSELRLMGQDVSAAQAAARRVETIRSASAPGSSANPGARPPGETGAAGVHYRVSGADVGVTYSNLRPERAPLALLPTRALVPGADSPAASRLAPSPAGYLSRDLIVRSLRGSLDYDLTRSLTVSLAYEALLDTPDRMPGLDDTSLKTFGLGYRLSPSTSVKLRYHLVDYREPSAPTGRTRDEVAETELVVRF